MALAVLSVAEEIRSFLARIGSRPIVRGAFLLFFVYACWRLWAFYLWATGAGPYVPRSEAVGGFVLLGAFMSLFAWIKSGVFDPVLPAAVVIVIGAIVTSVLFKRGFCGWICPLGTAADSVGWVGRRVFGRNLRVPRKLDIGLRAPKYLLGFGIAAWLVLLPVEVALSFQQLPYYATADIKILSLIVRPGLGYGLFALAVLGASVAFGNVWCRYLCPLGAVYGVCGVASPSSVGRDPDVCISCGACTEACPALLPVEDLGRVMSAECDGCQECVRVCPAPGALTARLVGATVRVPAWMWPVLVVVVWMLVWAVAVATGHWYSGVPLEAFPGIIEQQAI